MSETQELKRFVLRQTVAENLALIDGVQVPRERDPSASRTAGRWRVAALLLAPALLAGSALFLWPRAHGEVAPAARPAGEAAAPGAPRGELRSRWATEPKLTGVPPKAIDTSLLPLQVRRIVLDPGHGGEDVGTTNGRLREKDLTLDIARRLRDLLQAQAFEVSLTRDEDRALSLKERSDFANQESADLFMSIHINWIVTRAVRGVETYFLGPTDDPELASLARRENQDSGYALADQDSIIRGILLNAQHDRSHQLATKVQRSLYLSLRGVNPTLKDRGVKTAPFVVLVATDMPAILAEVSCLSNEEEAELLSRPLYRDHIAEALFEGVRGYADEVQRAEESAAEKGS